MASWNLIGNLLSAPRSTSAIALSLQIITLLLVAPTTQARLSEPGARPQKLPTLEILNQTKITPPHRWTWLGKQVSRDFAWQPPSPNYIGEIRREYDDVELNIDDPARLESVQVFAFSYDDTRPRQRELESAHRQLSQLRMSKLGLQSRDVQRRDRFATRNAAMQLTREDQFKWGTIPWVHIEQSVMVGPRILVFSMSGPLERSEEIRRLLKDLVEQSQIEP
ncbi:MAG TPA: hypothetical protein PLZ57_11600 [Pseudobdellovibrionaceae bacterium]|nr:hypothetical protein [Pseudobdellovibrionaceae bacterium]